MVFQSYALFPHLTIAQNIAFGLEEHGLARVRIRERVSELLERDPSVSVTGLCADLSEAVALSVSMQPDIVLLDGRMPEGAAAARRALDEAPGMQIEIRRIRRRLASRRCT
jgi:ABC-type sulfate/molybdate transport systems ATPase subunit